MKVAVVDLGTNTCRLLLADVVDGRLTSVTARETQVVRLGQGVDGRGRLAPAAVDRTLACLARYTAATAAYRPQRSLLFATSALRDASDGEEFLRRVEARYGWPWEIIEGDLEGRLAFRGAVAGLARPVQERLLVVDIGGGSTELIVGSGVTGQVAAVRSVDIGAVRLTERCFADDPPTDVQWAAASTLVANALAAASAEVAAAAGRPGVGLGVAGTFTTLVAYVLELREWRRELVDGYELSRETILGAVARFRCLTSAQRAELPGIRRGREDVILAGALIAAESCGAFGLDALRVSTSGILEGAGLWVAGRPDLG
ncbi:MAG: exopolyphosphatase [Thermoleophilia bacterium]|nr:exopolyphosphatase [Thermoleophilia bacterium]